MKKRILGLLILVGIVLGYKYKVGGQPTGQTGLIGLIGQTGLIESTQSTESTESTETTQSTKPTGTTNCGGNCPQGNCPQCPCGTSPNNISNYESFCKKHLWNANCCICISNRISKANAHHTKYVAEKDEYYLGMMGIHEETMTFLCKISDSKTLCNPTENYSCAHKMYIGDKHNWDYWYADAKACGCPVYSLEHETIEPIPTPRALKTQ